MVLKDNERLAFALERGLGDDVQNSAVVAEQLSQSCSDEGQLRALVDVMNLRLSATLCNAADGH